MTLIDAYLRDRYDALDLAGIGLSDPWSTVLVTPSFAGSRHVIGLVHSRPSREMKVVVKLPRRPGDDSGVQREASVLGRLHALAPAAASRAPRILALDRLGPQAVLVETAVTGSLLGPEVVRADAARALREGLVFIQALPLTGESGAEHGWYDRLVERPMRRLLEVVGDWTEAHELVRRTRAHLEPLRTASMPLVFEHGDLGHPNLVVRADGRLAAIDWERAEPCGLPLHDLAFHLAYLAEGFAGVFERPEQLRTFDETFLRAGAWGRRVLREELERLELDRALLAPLVLASWARTAAGLATRLWGDGEPDLPGGSHVPSATAVAAISQDRDFALWRHVEAAMASLEQA
jgi:Phosphotransferase enzyme family